MGWRLWGGIRLCPPVILGYTKCALSTIGFARDLLRNVKSKYSSDLLREIGSKCLTSLLGFPVPEVSNIYFMPGAPAADIFNRMDVFIGLAASIPVSILETASLSSHETALAVSTSWRLKASCVTAFHQLGRRDGRGQDAEAVP